MQQVTLEQVSLEEKTSKAGKPYTAAGIKVDGVWRNGFGSPEMRSWKAGDTVTVELFEEEFNGKMYKKFKAPNKTDLLEARVSALEKIVSGMGVTKEVVHQVSSEPPPPTEAPPEPPADFDGSDLPF